MIVKTDFETDESFYSTSHAPADRQAETSCPKYSHRHQQLISGVVAASV